MESFLLVVLLVGLLIVWVALSGRISDLRRKVEEQQVRPADARLIARVYALEKEVAEFAAGAGQRSPREYRFGTRRHQAPCASRKTATARVRRRRSIARVHLRDAKTRRSSTRTRGPAPIFRDAFARCSGSRRDVRLNQYTESFGTLAREDVRRGVGSDRRRKLAEQAGRVCSGDRDRIVPGLFVHPNGAARTRGDRAGREPDDADRRNPAGAACPLHDLRTRAAGRRMGLALLHNLRDACR